MYAEMIEWTDLKAVKSRRIKRMYSVTASTNNAHIQAFPCSWIRVISNFCYILISNCSRTRGVISLNLTEKKKKGERCMFQPKHMINLQTIQFYLNFTCLSSLIISKCLDKILKQKAKSIFPALTRLLHSPNPTVSQHSFSM